LAITGWKRKARRKRETQGINKIDQYLFIMLGEHYIKHYHILSTGTFF